MKLRMSKPALRRIVSGLGCMVLGAAIVVMPNIAAALDIGGIAQSLQNQFGFVGDLIGSAISSEERRVGTESVSTCRSRWLQSHIPNTHQSHQCTHSIISL